MQNASYFCYYVFYKPDTAAFAVSNELTDNDGRELSDVLAGTLDVAVCAWLVVVLTLGCMLACDEPKAELGVFSDTTAVLVWVVVSSSVIVKITSKMSLASIFSLPVIQNFILSYTIVHLSKIPNKWMCKHPQHFF